MFQPPRGNVRPTVTRGLIRPAVQPYHMVGSTGVAYTTHSINSNDSWAMAFLHSLLDLLTCGEQDD